MEPEPMSEPTESRIKHLEMIQAIIARMAGESARVKQMALVVVGVLASTAEAVTAPSLALVGAALSIVFWVLDARYLRLERLYRGHYDEVRSATGSADFSMDLSEVLLKKHTLIQAMRSWATSPIYGAILLICICLALVVQAAPTVTP